MDLLRWVMQQFKIIPIYRSQQPYLVPVRLRSVRNSQSSLQSSSTSISTGLPWSINFTNVLIGSSKKINRQRYQNDHEAFMLSNQTKTEAKQDKLRRALN